MINTLSRDEVAKIFSKYKELTENDEYTLLLPTTDETRIKVAVCEDFPTKLKHYFWINEKTIPSWSVLKIIKDLLVDHTMKEILYIPLIQTQSMNNCYIMPVGRLEEIYELGALLCESIIAEKNFNFIFHSHLEGLACIAGSEVIVTELMKRFRENGVKILSENNKEFDLCAK